MPALASRKALVIDDEPYIRNLIRDILERDGWDVFEVGNGQQALIAVPNNRFDLILLDLHMPTHSGHCFLADLRSSGLPIPPVLVVTGHEDEVDRLDAKVRPLVKAVLLKPFEIGELEVVVRRLSAS